VPVVTSISSGESVCSNVSCVGVVRLTYRDHRSSKQDGAITLPWSPVDPCHISPREMRSHPIGTGPFKFDEFEPNRSIKITRNPHYWKKDRPKALLEPLFEDLMAHPDVLHLFDAVGLCGPVAVLKIGRGSRPGFSSSCKMSLTVGTPNTASVNASDAARLAALFGDKAIVRRTPKRSMRLRRLMELAPKIFGRDSPLEGTGFEPSVPRERDGHDPIRLIGPASLRPFCQQDLSPDGGSFLSHGRRSRAEEIITTPRCGNCPSSSPRIRFLSA